jgi:hypothetical protein
MATGTNSGGCDAIEGSNCGAWCEDWESEGAGNLESLGGVSAEVLAVGSSFGGGNTGG